MYRFWQGLCISRALCLTFPAVEPITLQLTTAACCDQKEQLLGPHGGNSMRVPDRGTQNLIHQSDTPMHKGIQIYSAVLGLETEEREPWPGLREALTVCESKSEILLSFAIWVIQFHLQQKIRLVAMLSANGYSKFTLRQCRDSFQLCFSITWVGDYGLILLMDCLLLTL